MEARRTPRRLNAAVFEVFAHRSVRIWLIPLVALFPKPCDPPLRRSPFFFSFFPPSFPPFTARSNRRDIMFRLYEKKLMKTVFRDSHNYSFLRSIKLHPILVLTSHLRTRLLHKIERKKKKKKELEKKNNLDLLQFRSTRSITTMRQDYSH